MSSAAHNRLQIFAGTEGFGRIKQQWTELATREGTHFLHFPGWYEAQMASEAQTQNVYFVALYAEGGVLSGVLPFERVWLKKGRLKLPILQLYYPNEMGVNDVLADFPLHIQRRAIQGILRQHLPWFAFIRWQCVLANGHAATLLGGSERPRVTHHSKYIEFPQGSEAFWASHSSKFRKGLQKKLRKAEQDGEVRMVCENTSEGLTGAFEQFLEVENSGWKGENGTSVLKQPKKLAYYRCLMSAYGERGLCQVNLLYFNQEAVAAQFSICVNKTLYLLKIGYKETYKEVSPGHLLLAKLVDYGAETGKFNRVSFVTGVDWIDRWHPKLEPVGIFYTSSGGYLSGILVRLLAVAIGVKRWREARSDKAG